MQKQIWKVKGIGEEMTIAQIFDKYPEHVSELAEVMLSYGLHCVGCHVNQYESIKQGSVGHGMPENEFNMMLARLNDVVMRKKRLIEKVALTEKAVFKLKELVNKERRAGQMLRIKVIPGGCSGHSYELKFDNPGRDDEVVEQDGVKILVDKQSLMKIKGSELDYIEGLQGAGFKVNNPNAKSLCGCGHSFS